jgi:hypothetical protein
MTAPALTATEPPAPNRSMWAFPLNPTVRIALRWAFIGLSDALNVRYPTLYETGAEIATLELEIPNNGDSQPTWRLYRVNEAVPAS